MTSSTSIPYDKFIDETKCAVEQCYPESEGKMFISSETLLQEILNNSWRYPNFTKISTRHKKIALTQVCVHKLEWKKWGRSRGTGKSKSVYVRNINDNCYDKQPETEVC